jgi:hypothetical protein
VAALHRAQRFGGRTTIRQGVYCDRYAVPDQSTLGILAATGAAVVLQEGVEERIREQVRSYVVSLGLDGESAEMHMWMRNHEADERIVCAWESAPPIGSNLSASPFLSALADDCPATAGRVRSVLGGDLPSPRWFGSPWVTLNVAGDSTPDRIDVLCDDLLANAEDRPIGSHVPFLVVVESAVWKRDVRGGECVGITRLLRQGRKHALSVLIMAPDAEGIPNMLACLPSICISDDAPALASAQEFAPMAPAGGLYVAAPSLEQGWTILTDDDLPMSDRFYARRCIDSGRADPFTESTK